MALNIRGAPIPLQVGGGARFGAPGGVGDPNSGYSPEGITSGVTPGDDPLYYVPDTQRYASQSEKELLQLKARLAQEALDKNLPSMTALFGSGGGGTAAPTVTYGGPALTGAQDLAFARAKDRAGLLAKSAATSVRENAAARGVLGAGFEGEDIAKQAIAPSMNILGDLNAKQMSQAYDAASHAADISYQGAITQRGQDQQTKLASMEALLSALKGFM